MRKPSLSRSAVLAVLDGCMGPVSGLTPAVEGQESQAYRFRSAGGTYVLRFNHAGEGFEKDAFAYGMFARPELPIPKVIRIGQADGCFYCISENMPGLTLQDLKPEDLAPVLGPTSRVMDAIARSDVSQLTGAGPFSPRGAGSYKSWHNFLASPHQWDWAAVARLLDLHIVNRVLERLDALSASCPETRGLIHGDFGSNNVVTDGRRITGVFDWSEASVGDPLYDVANIFFWRTWLDCMRQQAAHFEARRSDLSGLTDRLLCYQLRIGLAEMYQNAIEHRPRAAAWAVSRCCELIR